VGRYQKGKTNLDFTEARDSEWQWHQLGQSTEVKKALKAIMQETVSGSVISWAKALKSKKH